MRVPRGASNKCQFTNSFPKHNEDTFAVAGMQQWQCKTVDIKSVFLQGQKITRDV